MSVKIVGNRLILSSLFFNIRKIVQMQMTAQLNPRRTKKGLVKSLYRKVASS